MELQGRQVVVAVDGGPGAFEAAELVRRLIKAGARVQVAVTASVEAWLPALTLETVSTGKVARTPEDAGPWSAADACVLAGAGADLIARLAAGRADDAVTALFARGGAPWLILPAPGLPEGGWVRANLSALTEGAELLEPGLDASEVVARVVRACGPRDLADRKVVVTAGPTREHLDPVRFLSNPSTGKMGYALAAAAARRGAQVVLVSGPVALEAPAGVRRVQVVSARGMAEAVEAESAEFDVFIGAAAVADWTPAEVAPEKVKKGAASEQALRLVRTPDVLAELSARVAGRPDRPVLVGFAAETEQVVEHARAKLVRKNLDLIVANDVKGPGGAFGADTNAVVVVDAQGARALTRASKRRVADAILDAVLPILEARRPR